MANKLLKALPQHDRDCLLHELEKKSLNIKDSVYESDRPIEQIAFPLNGIVSLVQMSNGAMVEVATIGNEGMVGIPLVLGADQTFGIAFCQVPGEFLMMKANPFRRMLQEVETLRSVLQLYTQTLILQIAQGTACNSLHTIEQRCARWLLMSHDRVGRDDFPLTHEFLSQMLAVRRAGVSEVAARLQTAGLISYVRGIITIVDREGLEARSCECYWIIRREFDRLLHRG